MNVFSPMQGMNAFAQGANIGGNIRQQETQSKLAPLVANGQYQQAAQVAGERGDLGGAQMYQAQYQDQLAQMSAEEKAAAAERAQQLGKLAFSVRNSPYEQRQAAISNALPLLQGMGIDPQSIQGFDPTDQSLDAIISQARDMEALVSQANTDRAFDYRVGRDAVGDQRYEQEYTDTRADRTEDVDFRNQQYERGIYENDRAYAARTAPDPGSWASAGEGTIYNTRTGDMKGGGTFDANTGMGNYGYAPPPSSEGGFFQIAFGDTGGQVQEGFQGIDPQATAPGQPLPQINQAEYQKYRGSSLAKSDAQQLEEARAASTKYSTAIRPKLDTLSGMLEAGVPTGAYSGIVRGVGERVPALRGNFGVPDKDELARADTFESAANQLVLDMASVAKGSMSDSDRAFFTTMAPQLSQTDPAFVIDALERQGQRNQEYADGAEIWNVRYGGLSLPNENGETFTQLWTQYVSENPIVPGTSTNEVGGGVTRIQDAQGYAALPSGATYVAPDGITRRKP